MEYAQPLIIRRVCPDNKQKRNAMGLDEMNWTPVEKAMPQGGRMCISDAVLVTVSNMPDDFHVVRVDRYDAHSKTWEHSNPQHDRARVTAWMPLPAPYKPNGKG